MNRVIKTETEMLELGVKLAKMLPDNFCLELYGDIGAGKTTLVKGIVSGFNKNQIATSPSFTINNRYQITKDYQISHYDFYRLGEVGILSQELEEDILDKNTSVIIEWPQNITKFLPEKRVVITIQAMTDDSRKVNIEGLV